MLADISDEELILRRFDPDNPEVRDAYTVDEGSSPRYRLRGGALTGFSIDGCSVSRDRILVAAGISRDEVLRLPKFRKLAEASVAAVRECSIPDHAGNELRPFEVLADSYPMADPSPQRDLVAHALIRLDAPTKKFRTIAVGKLSRFVFNPLDAP